MTHLKTMLVRVAALGALLAAPTFAQVPDSEPERPSEESETEGTESEETDLNPALVDAKTSAESQPPSEEPEPEHLDQESEAERTESEEPEGDSAPAPSVERAPAGVDGHESFESQSEAEAEAEVEPEPEPEPEEPDGEPEPKEKPSPLVKPFARQGHFLSLGLHYSGATADDADRGWRKLSQGPAFNLRLGEAIVDWADIGLEFGAAFGGGDEKLTTGRIIAHTRLYPHERLFVHTGLGFGFAGGPDPKFEDFDRVRYGDVYVLGLGTNLYLNKRNRSGGPIVSPVASFEIGPDNEFTTLSFWAGVEIAWWGGLSKDKLDLPLERAYSNEKKVR